MTAELPSDGKSGLRKQVEPTAIKIMTEFHHLFPSVTPNNVTQWSGMAYLLGDFIQEQAHVAGLDLNPKLGGLIFALKGGGSLGDKADGSLATVFDIEEPGKHDREFGQRYDAKWDRFQEAGAALLRARTAYERHDLVGELAAYGAAITCAMPAIEKARIETLGIKTPELGNNFFEGLGTRLGRIFFTELASLETIKGIPVQPAADIAATAANLNNARVRRRYYDRYKNYEFAGWDQTDEFKQVRGYGETRLREMEEIQLSIIFASEVTFRTLRSQ